MKNKKSQSEQSSGVFFNLAWNRYRSRTAGYHIQARNEYRTGEQFLSQSQGARELVEKNRGKLMSVKFYRAYSNEGSPQAAVVELDDSYASNGLTRCSSEEAIYLLIALRENARCALEKELKENPPVTLEQRIWFTAPRRTRDWFPKKREYLEKDLEELDRVISEIDRGGYQVKRSSYRKD